MIGSQSGAKSYTCVDDGTIQRIRWELLESDTGSWIRVMMQLGMRKSEALELAEKLWKE